MMQDINNVLITASSHGLGYAIAKKFSENNCGIIIHGRDSEKIEHAKKNLENVIDTITGDLREEKTIELIAESAANHEISILVNNAAIPCYGLALNNMSDPQINESLSVNLIAPIILAHRLYPILKKAKSSGIININSIVGIEPKENRSIHSATKWGLKGFSKSLRIEAAHDNMRVINVYPTRIKTVEEYTYGLDPDEVAEVIYKNIFNPSGSDEIVIDGRPEIYKNKARIT